MGNLLLEEVEYKIEETNFGVWRRYGYANGTSYHEFKSHKSMFGMPLVHYTYGKNPETGRRVIAKGVIAIGRIACGIIAIGHASFGLLAIGQLAIGLAFGLGQLSTGLMALGQAAIGVMFGVGQFTTGYIAIGQLLSVSTCWHKSGKGSLCGAWGGLTQKRLNFLRYCLSSGVSCLNCSKQNCERPIYQGQFHGAK